MLQGLGGLAQPCSLTLVEVWRERVAHLLVVVVEPCHLFGEHHLSNDGGGVYGAKCERLELQELPKLCLLVGCDEQRVLYAHTETPRKVQPGLVGHRHAGLERCGHVLHAYLVRPLVHVEIGAHAVPGAMHIVHALAPHGTPGEYVQLGSRGSARKLAKLKLDVPLENERVDAPLFVCERAERYGAGDIGGAVFVLRATVQQQEAPWLQRRVGVGRGLVAHVRPMLRLAPHGVETDLAKQPLLGAQVGELLADGHLCLPARLDGWLEPP